MKAIQTIILLFIINFAFTQSTVHLSILEEGRGLLRSRSDECFVIAPYHLVEGVEARSITITGYKQKVSKGKFIKQFPGDIAIIKVESGADQDCQNFSVPKNYAESLEKTFDGYLEIRNEDGSINQEMVHLKKKSSEGITIQAKDPNFQFAKGMSGSSLFGNFNGVRTYLGMLLSVDESNTKYGNVFQADDMERIMQEFFDTGLPNIQNKTVYPQDNYNKTTTSPQECESNNTGDYCFQNSTNKQINIFIRSLDKKKKKYSISIGPNQTQCFYSLPIGVYEFKDLMDFVSSFCTIKGQIKVERCRSNTYRI